ncbi:cysteine proteinase 6-like [Daphnia pulicaria]|uniref:cysteine proteinase 6-like n=1 Tax=Daphnia pulicaria TaxID=35523 RepID=UPI001EECE93A|nr:cysteine proteinase 6-like [Daphnia pulicaria]
MAPIRNQAACGSCWSFAAINPLEFSACNKTATKVLTPLSEQHLIDCDLYDNACNGGWPTNAWYHIKTKNGSAKAASYAYSSATCCTTSCCARKACKYTASMLGAKVSNFGNVGSSSSNNTASVMQSALLQYGPLAVAIATASSFMSYKSGVYNDVACDNKTVCHQHCRVW